MKPREKTTKECYEKPTLVIEQIQLATVAGQYGHGSVDQLQPFFGLCAPCEPQPVGKPQPVGS